MDPAVRPHQGASLLPPAVPAAVADSPIAGVDIPLRVLGILKESGLLNEANQGAILGHGSSKAVCEVLSRIKILPSQMALDALLANVDLLKESRDIQTLAGWGLLHDRKSLEMIRSLQSRESSDSCYLMNSLGILNQNHLLNEATGTAVSLQEGHLSRFHEILLFLLDVHALTQDNLKGLLANFDLLRTLYQDNFFSDLVENGLFNDRKSLEIIDTCTAVPAGK